MGDKAYKELTVLSGKGGTGKTSLVAAFAALAREAVLADCDVDAADLHLILQPCVQTEGEFSGGSVASVRTDLCTACGLCGELCRFDAIKNGGLVASGAEAPRVDPLSCEGCGVCAWFCPADAIAMTPRRSGRWYESHTRFGPMAHAELIPGQENSGKLVSLVRERARTLAERNGRRLIVVDGAPGVGCPVIASATGADAALIVTEPTIAGRHDLERVLGLVEHFEIPAAVCVNRYDINVQVTEEIEALCRGRGVINAGRVRYARDVVRAMMAGRTVIELAGVPIAGEIEAVWKRTLALLDKEAGEKPAGEDRKEE
ncbi:MAG: (4Fe-4S)-binding protein [Candidatus Eisenbacteria bacterium]|nr:(4Fe-4S)-binding protein [Candidatus Eisenbacteria bacterium]